jgi:hypothetical protein
MCSKTRRERDFTDMKKNKMMRTASALLVLVLLTVSIICGTFAKYTTAGSVSDSAKVAEWGIEITASGSLFEKNYLAASSNEATVTSAGITVKSSGTGDVVAPGTKNSDGVELTVSGKAETDVKLTFSMTATNSTGSAIDVSLGEGEYTYTADNKKVTLGSAYNPIKYTLSKKSSEGNDYTVVTSGALSVIETCFNNLTTTSYAGSKLSDTYKLTWEWKYESGKDTYDTLLGDLAAGKVTGKDGSYSINPNVQLSITATQVD